MMVGIDDLQFAHFGAPWLRRAELPRPMAGSSAADAAFCGSDDLIVALMPAIATSRGRRIRRSDNLRGRLRAIVMEVMGISASRLLRYSTHDEETKMIKVLSMMKRKEDMSLDEFRHWLTQEHVKFARQIPGLLKFVVNIPETDSPDNPFDAVNELYFADEAAMQQAFGSDAGKASGADALAHISARSRLVTVEHRLID
jgi:uncharacterized protein (TIGR02118 family)